MREVLLSALLFVTGFDDHVSCTIQGHVFRMAEADDVAFQRVDSCQAVRVEQTGKQLMMYSPNFWVLFVVPADYGHRRFMYRWGSHLVHVGAETMPVTDWGYTEKG